MQPTSTSAMTMEAGFAAGPLAISTTNPRYFTVASPDGGEQRAVYLTGSHIWSNFHDGMGPGPECSGTLEHLDFDAYLAFLKDHGHNFIRLWRWEQFRSQAAGGAFHLCMTPQPWSRTGTGQATDGGPKFDLAVFDEAYFRRLRERVIAAGKAGIYVGVMFFDGWALHLSPPPYNVEGHPFFATNNVNGIGIDSIVDYQVLPLAPRVQAIQEAYIRKVIDTVQDLPNVLYEVANESAGGGDVDQEFAELLGLGEPPNWGDSTQWQYWVINLAKAYEKERGYDSHPIGMTMQFPVADQTRVNEPLYDGPADWISPGFDQGTFNPAEFGSGRWFTDPPPADGRKVVITDTDHYAPGMGDALWAWKSFLRGHHPILMDFGIIDGVQPGEPSPGAAPYETYEAARFAMGDTRRFAERIGLIAMEPRGELSSTGYALANPGSEYLVLRPNDAPRAFSVELAAGTYAAEWFDVETRRSDTGDQVSVAGKATADFASPFGSERPAVLYLHRIDLAR